MANRRMADQPPPGFTGFEQGDWEDERYCRALSGEELAALIAAGIADASDDDSPLSIEDDEAERDSFFTSLAARACEPAVE